MGGYKNINDFTGSVISDSILPIKTWIKYIKCMLKSYSLPKCSKEVGISVTTAFELRYKILNEISNTISTKLDGIIQANETFIHVSYKGNHSKPSFSLLKTARKRGGQTKLCALIVKKYVLVRLLTTYTPINTTIVLV